MAFRKFPKRPLLEVSKSLQGFGVIDIERSEQAANRTRHLGRIFKKRAVRLCGLQVLNRTGFENRTDIVPDESKV